MSEYTLLWLEAFIWTLAIELPLVVLTMRRSVSKWWIPVLLAVVVNTTTHPLLWFVFPRFGDYATWVTIAEAFVWFTEAIMLTFLVAPDVGLKRAAIIGPIAAIVANAASTAVGLLFFQ